MRHIKIVKRIFFLVLILLIPILRAEEIIKEKREVLDFNKITILGVGNLYIKQGNKEVLTIEGENNILSNIQSEIKDHHLLLGPKQVNLNINNPINYYLTVNDVTEIHASGKININGQNNLVVPQLLLTLAGDSQANLKVKVEKFNIKIIGNGNVKAAGTTQEQMIDIAGAGDFNGKKLFANKVAVTISGSGTAEVQATQELNVKIFGFGKVKYYGVPTIIQEIAGGGEIIPL